MRKQYTNIIATDRVLVKIMITNATIVLFFLVLSLQNVNSFTSTRVAMPRTRQYYGEHHELTKGTGVNSKLLLWVPSSRKTQKRASFFLLHMSSTSSDASSSFPNNNRSAGLQLPTGLVHKNDARNPSFHKLKVSTIPSSTSSSSNSLWTTKKKRKVEDDSNVGSKSLYASGQDQLAVPIRIAKAIYEESGPWILTLLGFTILSLLCRTPLPLQLSLTAEILFFIKCTFTLLSKFNKPQPFQSQFRDWKEVVELVWDSSTTVKEKRHFLMGWFYDAPFESLRREDAIRYLVWMKYGIAYEELLNSNDESDHVKLKGIEEFDLVELERHVNGGQPLLRRVEGEDTLPCIRFNIEPLRYRHKPLLFYAVTHGAFLFLRNALQKSGFEYVPAKDSKKDIAYWYKAGVNNGNTNSAESQNPLVLVHGVGGLITYYKLIQDVLEMDTPILLLNLPHVSLRVQNDIPDIASQVESICKALDNITPKTEDNSPPKKATFVGHSYGSILLSWMVQSKPERVASCVFMDPICFNLHLKDTLFNFHMTRVDKGIQEGQPWNNPLEIGSLINLAGTEMHTNYAMLREFSWAANSLWPKDLTEQGIPSSILLSENDTIVPSSEVYNMFKTFQSNNSDVNTNLDFQVLKNADHGEMFVNDELRSLTAENIKKMHEAGQIQQQQLLNTLSNTNGHFDYPSLKQF